MKMELVMKKQPYLTEGQKHLYSLVCEKIKTNSDIIISEILAIYTKYSCKNFRNGKCYYWDYYHKKDNKGEWHGGYKLMSQELLKYYVLLWLTRNIGALVLKGYLKVIPAIKLDELTHLS